MFYTTSFLSQYSTYHHECDKELRGNGRHFVKSSPKLNGKEEMDDIISPAFPSVIFDTAGILVSWGRLVISDGCPTGK